MTLRQVVEAELQAAYERGLKDGAAAEREACAKVCDEDKNMYGNNYEYLSQFESGCCVTAEFLAEAIRARGQL